MKLISQSVMMKLKWRTFEEYPEQGVTIVLHVKGYMVRENKNVHQFHTIKFDALKFDKREFTPELSGTVWEYTWLPVEGLMVESDD